METYLNHTESKNGGDAKKGELARKKILWAARLIFARQPYHAASLRMIAKEGGFDHPLIRYYFPTKADLFKAVVAEVVGEFAEAHFRWIKGLDLLPPSKALPQLIGRIVDYHYENPEGMNIIMQNISQMGRLSSIPGYEMLPDLLMKMRGNFRLKIPLSGPEAEIEQFYSSLFVTVVLYLGASSTTAQFLGLDSSDSGYRGWVKDSLVFQFLPWMARLALPSF